MLAKIVKIDDKDKAVVEVTGFGFFVIQHTEHKPFPKVDFLSGRFDSINEYEIEVSDSRRQTFKIFKLAQFADFKEASDNLISGVLPPCAEIK
jgi:hypothetical protein